MNTPLGISFLVTALYFGVGAVLFAAGLGLARESGILIALVAFMLLTWRAVYILLDWAGLDG